jgi:hypothetical protein
MRRQSDATSDGGIAERTRLGWGLAIALGAYLSLNGYRAFEGDQAYRLPLLIDRLEPSVYASDPFVRAFDAFNPHAGYLDLLGATSRVLGLSGALLFWFAATFLVTAWGVWRLGRAAWRSEIAGWVAVGLMLATRAGSIGTNHLFEPMLLDRLMAMGLGWVAVAEMVEGRRRAPWTTAGSIGAAQWVHPALGLQLGLWLGLGWLGLRLADRGSRTREEQDGEASRKPTPGVGERAAGGRRVWSRHLPSPRPSPQGKGGTRGGWYWLGLGLTAMALLPAIVRLPSQSATVLGGLSAEDLYRLAALVQSPQHLVPHLWRFEQWAAWVCLVGLGGGALMRGPRDKVRRRLSVLLGIVILGLAAALAAIEGCGDLRVTLFQPFRMATVARGLAVVGLDGYVLRLWSRGTWTGWARAGLIAGGLTSDWAFVVAVVVESVALGVGVFMRHLASTRLKDRDGILEAGSPTARLRDGQDRPARAELIALVFSLATGLAWLRQHDTRDGPIRLIAGMGAAVLIGGVMRRVGVIEWSRWRGFRLAAYAWAVPAAAAIVAMSGPWSELPAGVWLTTHLRLSERPIDDEERLGAWCRENLPAGARLIGPPGPKGLRLWSRRAVAFNRAASPYHAAGLADWASRYCDHVGLPNSPAALAEAYLKDRHGLEAQYDALDAEDLASLARRHGADHVIARPGLETDAALVPLHAEGGLGVYRVARRADRSG